MYTYECASALPVQIEISHVELFARSLQLGLVCTVDGPRQTKLGAVRNVECIVVVRCFDYCQHWSKDLLLFDGVAWFDISNHRRLDEESLFAIGTTPKQHSP